MGCCSSKEQVKKVIDKTDHQTPYPLQTKEVSKDNADESDQKQPSRDSIDSSSSYTYIDIESFHQPFSIPFNLKNIKFVDDKAKHLLFGYFHAIQTQLSIEYIIPESIILSCILYYHQFEYFTKNERYGDGIWINEEADNLVARRIQSYSSEVYLYEETWVFGNMIIDKSMNATFVWTIKIIQVKQILHIGIASENKYHRKSYGNERCEKDLVYQLSESGHGWTNVDVEVDKVFGKRDPNVQGSGEGFGEGDVVKMELDTANEWLKFYVNEVDCGVAFENIFTDKYTKEEVSFRLSIYVYNVAVIELANFEIIH